MYKREGKLHPFGVLVSSIVPSCVVDDPQSAERSHPFSPAVRGPPAWRRLLLRREAEPEHLPEDLPWLLEPDQPGDQRSALPDVLQVLGLRPEEASDLHLPLLGVQRNAPLGVKVLSFLSSELLLHLPREHLPFTLQFLGTASGGAIDYVWF
jgi:hypothetical protein